MLSGFVISLIVVSYLFLYTPLKRKTSLCTLIGAVPGALPPVVGWVAARGALTGEAWVLFTILFLWQIPHSLAIAYIYREDYAECGIPFVAGHFTRMGRVRVVKLWLTVSHSSAVGLCYRRYTTSPVAFISSQHCYGRGRVSGGRYLFSTHTFGESRTLSVICLAALSARWCL